MRIRIEEVPRRTFDDTVARLWRVFWIIVGILVAGGIAETFGW